MKNFPSKRASRLIRARSSARMSKPGNSLIHRDHTGCFSQRLAIFGPRLAYTDLAPRAPTNADAAHGSFGVRKRRVQRVRSQLLSSPGERSEAQAVPASHQKPTPLQQAQTSQETI